MADWIRESVIYQIFPERFAIGQGKQLKEKVAADLYPAQATLKSWQEEPTVGADAGSQFFGGDLWGVTEKLDYLQDLGVTAVYLNPVFPAPSNHKYDALSYREIDAGFGGMAAFDSLLDGLHKRGMHLIFDLALNHVSDQHPYFQEAISDPKSPYRDYFKFRSYPETYDCWWGLPHMPELNFDHPAVLEEFICGDDSVLAYWIDKGVDAIRLDTANDLGEELCQLICQTAKARRSDMLVIGEVFCYAAAWQKRLDSIQSYWFSSSAMALLNHRIGTQQFMRNISDYIQDSSVGKELQTFNILSSHDYPRVLTQLSGSLLKLKQALLLQYTLPGVPVLYYGDEIGMEGGEDPLNRAPMPWNRESWRPEILELYRAMIGLRQSRAELQRGQFRDLSASLQPGIIAYMRFLPDVPEAFSLVVLNVSEEVQDCEIFVPYSYFFSTLLLEDCLGQREVKNQVSNVSLILQPGETCVFVPDADYRGHYTYFKKRQLPVSPT